MTASGIDGFVARLEDRALSRLLGRRMRRLANARSAAAGAEQFSTRTPAVFRAQEELIGRYAPGRSFIDLACLWQMDGSCAFLAEELGADSVTASDLSPASEAFEAERERRASRVSFAQADLHDTDQVAALGVHDVVWCSGLMYHTPLPYLVMANLLSITGEYLIIGSKVLPSVPGLPGAAVYYPGLDAADRRRYATITRTVANQPFEREQHGAGWFWGLSPEALVGLATSIRDVELVEELRLPWLRRHDSYYAVLRARGGSS